MIVASLTIFQEQKSIHVGHGQVLILNFFSMDVSNGSSMTGSS